MDKKVVALVQARMGSTRLPGKVLADILGKPMLWHIVNRLSYCKLVDQTIIATADNDKNKPIAEVAKQYAIPCYSGSEVDLVDRFYQAARKFDASVIVRITADCPLVDPEIVDELIDIYLHNIDRYDYVSNSRPKASYPHGLDAEVFGVNLVKNLWQTIEEPFRREWFTTVIFENPEKYKLFCLKSKENLSQIRLTVDYQEDLDLVREIFTRLYKEDRCFYLKDMLDLLSANQELLDINKKYKRDEQYIQELKKRRGE